MASQSIELQSSATGSADTSIVGDDYIVDDDMLVDEASESSEYEASEAGEF